MSINLHSLELKNMLKFSIVEISQLLGSLDFFFFFSELQAKNGNFQMQHQGLLFCWLSCSAGVICFSKTSRNAKVGLREHIYFLRRKEGISPCCLWAVMRGGRGRRGDTPCSLHLNVKFVDCYHLSAAYPTWHFSSSSWLAGFLFF